MILERFSDRLALLERSRTVAIVGASANTTRPSYFVFSYLRTQGRLEPIPVNPRIDAIDGVKAYPSLAALARERGAPDIVDVFRNPADAAEAAREAVAVGAKAVWFQYGVASDEAVRIADAAGLEVVVNRCIKVESARFDGGLSVGGFNSGLVSSRRGRPLGPGASKAR